MYFVYQIKKEKYKKFVFRELLEFPFLEILKIILILEGL